MVNSEGINIQIVNQSPKNYIGYSIGANGLHFYEFGNIKISPEGLVYNPIFFGTSRECKAKFFNYSAEPEPKPNTPRLLAEKQLRDLTTLLDQIEDKMNSKKNNGKYNKVQRKPGTSKIKQ
jgi:hypothetical protein